MLSPSVSESGVPGYGAGSVGRFQDPRAQLKPELRSPELLYDTARPHFKRSLTRVEELWVFPLNSRLQQTGKPYMASRGDALGTEVSVPTILRHVLLCRLATSFVLVHNHPTDVVEPSQADIAVTRRVITGARAVGLELQEHLVIGFASWHSMRRCNGGLWI